MDIKHVQSTLRSPETTNLGNLLATLLAILSIILLFPQPMLSENLLILGRNTFHSLR